MKTLVMQVCTMVIVSTLIAPSVRSLRIREALEPSQAVQPLHGEQAASQQQNHKERAHNGHHGGGAKHWGYRNEDRSLLPKNWHLTHSECSGKRQSPINIISISTLYDKSLSNITIELDDGNGASDDGAAEGDQSTMKPSWQLVNNGHTLMVSPQAGLSGGYSFTQADGMRFKFLQMHFHWRGSEHFIDGQHFVAELHLVHRSTTDPNQFAVIGYLFKLSNENNEALNPILDHIKKLVKYNSKYDISGTIGLERLIPFQILEYFKYPGSLTTPGCDEKVSWHVVADQVLTISEDQLLDFQTLEDSHGYPILSNSRPIQEINERLVLRSFYSIPSSRFGLTKIGNRFPFWPNQAYVSSARSATLTLPQFVASAVALVIVASVNRLA